MKRHYKLNLRKNIPNQNHLTLSEQIYSLHQEIYDWAFKFCHTAQDARDICHDVLIKAITKQHEYKRDTNLSAWLRTLCRNHFIDLQRQKERRRTIKLSDYTPAEPSKLHTIDKDLIRQCIYQLPIKERNILTLYLYGYTPKEISQELNMKYGLTRQYLMTGKNKLYFKLQELKNL